MGWHGRRVGILGGIGLTLVLMLGGCGGAWTQLSSRLRAEVDARQAYDAGLDRYNAGDYARAIPHFQRALGLVSDFDDAEAHLAWSYYYVGNYREATRHYRQTIARQPKWEGLYDGLGWSRYRLQRYHLAAEAFRQALDLNPRYRDASVGLAYSLFESARYAEALPLLGRLTRDGEGPTPQQPAADLEEVRGRLAWTLFYLGKYEEAKAEFTKGIAARPDWYGLYNGLGWTCLKLGDHVRARESFRQALRLKPGYADAKAGLAEVRR